MKPSFALNIMIIYNVISFSIFCLIGRSMHPLAGKYRYLDIFRGNYLSREANSPKLLGTNIVQGQLSEHVFLKLNEAIVFIVPQIFFSQHAEF